MVARTTWLIVAGTILAVAALAFVVRVSRLTETTPARRGAAVAERLGCFACHGPEGRGGVADPGSRNGMLPGWDGPTVATLVANDAELHEWILDGLPARLRVVETVARRTPLVPMPAYRNRISESELADLLVYFRAVSLFGIEIPEPAYEGWIVADRLGCFGCHGPNGTGGSPNPGSFKGHIPAWDGAEFSSLVKDDAELVEWILDGHPRRLRENPAARFFLDAQVIGMPGYRAHLSLDDQARLVAYFQWLRNKTKSNHPASHDDAHRILGLMTAPGRK